MSLSLLLRTPFLKGTACLLRFYSIQDSLVVLHPPILSFIACYTRFDDKTLLLDLVSVELQIGDNLI